MREATLFISQYHTTVTLALKGDWTKTSVSSLDKHFATSLTCNAKNTYLFDFSAIEAFDTHGIMLILHHIKHLEKMGCVVSIQEGSEHFQKLYTICAAHFPNEKIPEKK